MAKFNGMVGYSIVSETTPGVWEESYTERPYVGDVARLSRAIQTQQNSTNDNVVLSNQITIVADAFAFENFFNIRYVRWLGSKWKVRNVEVNRPRLILTLSEVFNGG